MPETKSIRVYEYGCGVGEIERLEVAVEQMRRRTDFWNHLVEIDSDVRRRMDALLFAGNEETELTSLRAELDDLMKRGSVVRSGDVNATEDDEKKTIGITALRAAVRSRLQDVKRIRKENAELHRAELRELDAESKARIAIVQASAGLYWANRDEIRRKYEFAREAAMRRGTQLRAQQWDETGKVRIQFQRGLPVAGAFLKNGRLQVDRVPEASWNSPSRSERRRMARTQLRIRVAANDDRSPVWLNVPIVLHRPLPEGGVIRAVSFIRERVGLSWRHRVLITVSEAPKHSDLSDKAVGVDVGWRLTDQGLRIAYWVDRDGLSGELLLPISDLSEFKMIGTLETTITRAFQDMVASLASLVEKHSMPPQIEESIRAAFGSSSPAALLHLLEEWRVSRFSGDRGVFSKLRTWRRQHVHLWTWQANLRDQLIRRRRELYRRFSADLASRYGQIFVNDIRLGRLTVRPETTRNFIPIQRYHRFIAAVSVLCRILESTCEKRGATFKLLEAHGATMSCSLCGTMDDWDPRTELTHKCSGCGGAWDQDLNAARNVLNKGLALSSQPSTL